MLFLSVYKHLVFVERFSHPFILTFHPFNILRKVFKCFVVRLWECSIHLTVISGKTLKTVSFHTGSRGVLHKIFQGIQFQQTLNRIAYLQFNHVHWFESTTYRFTLQLNGEFNWKYGQIGLLLPVVSELHTMKLLIKQLTNREDWVLRGLKIIETDISRTIQIQRFPRRNSKIPSFGLVHLWSIKRLSSLF